MSIASLTMNEKVSLLKELYHDIASKGQDGDTMLAHINPEEAALLKAHGGSGTINPTTGLPEYKKAIKTVVKVAAVAAAVYYGGPAIAKAFGGKAATFGSTAFWKGSTTASSLFTGGLKASTLLQAGGAALNAYSNIQAQKYAGEQTGLMREAQNQQNKANEARNRYNKMLQQRQKIAIARQARVNQAVNQTNTVAGGVSYAGTSSALNSVGATGTNAATNTGNITLAANLGDQLTTYNRNAANAMTSANEAGMNMQAMNSLGTFGSTVFNKSDEIINFGGKLKSIFT